jgi:ribosomal-protein-alanine N-acetyltransferase
MTQDHALDIAFLGRVGPGERLLRDSRFLPELVVPKKPIEESIKSFDWRAGMPVLHGAQQTVREVRLGDARSLCEALATDQVARFTVAPPSSPEGFERFIRWAHEQRASGLYACFTMVPHGSDEAVGLIQVRHDLPSLCTADWGFALQPRLWGTGLFIEAAELVLDFTFRDMGVHRLEARSLIDNGRANGALQKLGAMREGTLRQAFARRGDHYDESMWAIIRDEWWQGRGMRAPTLH